MSERPRVVRMVMFKHGVAYLERRGPAEGAFELSFRRDEMNDVLKSLAVWVARGDARVGAIAFEAPEDPDKALAERKLLLGPGVALEGLLQSLRGRRVAVSDGQARHEGEVLGVQLVTARDTLPQRSLLLRRADSPHEVLLVDLAHVRQLSLLEEPSRDNLAFIVDRGRAATSGENRIVRVAVDGRAEELRASYVIPAPTWRVSYRLVREEGSTLMMAMGIVHNPVDEDLDDIELTLTTGQPVSFVIDLYTPKRVERAVVEETTRRGAAPTRFERAPGAPPMVSAAAPAARSRRASAAAVDGFDGGGGDDGEAMQDEASMAASFAESAEGAAVGVDRGELFEYRVASRVSLKRGGSAMVPLISARVDARKERIWRDGSGPSPDLVLTFRNDTGAVLEEGPSVIYDDGVYAGESMVPYSPRGAEIKLAFAKDLALRCRRETVREQIFTGLRLGKHALVEELRNEERHVIIVESDASEPALLIAELPRQFHRTLIDAAPYVLPFEETASFWRFKTEVPPHGKASILACSTHTEQRSVRYDSLTAAQLAQWRRTGKLDESALATLTEVLKMEEEAKRLDRKVAQLEKVQRDAYAKQTKISEQLGVLKEGGPEGALRLRYVKELEAEQDRVNGAEQEITAAREAAEQKRAQATERLTAMTG